jgi:hypothetical protein
MTFQSLASQRFWDLYDKLPAEIQGAGRQTVRAIFRASRPSFVEVQACRAVLAGTYLARLPGEGNRPGCRICRSSVRLAGLNWNRDAQAGGYI